MCSLHYAVVALGTPNVTFLVALDTGSDLFWVPCDCVKCAPLSSPSYGVCYSSILCLHLLHCYVLFVTIRARVQLISLLPRDILGVNDQITIGLVAHKR